MKEKMLTSSFNLLFSLVALDVKQSPSPCFAYANTTINVIASISLMLICVIDMVKRRRLAKEVNVPASPRVVGTRSSSAMKSVTLMLVTVGCVFFFFWTYNPVELERIAERFGAVFFSIKKCSMCKVSLVRITGLQMTEWNETFDN